MSRTFKCYRNIHAQISTHTQYFLSSTSNGINYFSLTFLKLSTVLCSYLCVCFFLHFHNSNFHSYIHTCILCIIVYIYTHNILFRSFYSILLYSISARTVVHIEYIELQNRVQINIINNTRNTSIKLPFVNVLENFYIIYKNCL